MLLRALMVVVSVSVLAASCQRHARVSEAIPELPEHVMSTEVLEDGIFVEYVDVDLDGSLDAVRRYEVLDEEGEVIDNAADASESARENLRQISKDLDVNGDQQMDVFRFYSSNGELVREEMDVNFDGAVDRVRHFDGAAVTHKESDTDGDGVADTVRYYRGGALFRVEVDADENGIAETYFYYDEQGLHRRGTDVDEDGTIDDWTRRAAALTPTQPAEPGAADAANAEPNEGSGDAAE